MENNSKSVEKQLEEATTELLKIKKSIPRLVCVGLFLCFAFPYFPLRHGSLISNYGYWNSVVFTLLTYIIIIPVWISLKISKKKSEIAQLEYDLEMHKRFEKLKE